MQYLFIFSNRPITEWLVKRGFAQHATKAAACLSGVVGSKGGGRVGEDDGAGLDGARLRGDSEGPKLWSAVSTI